MTLASTKAESLQMIPAKIHNSFTSFDRKKWLFFFLRTKINVSISNPTCTRTGSHSRLNRFDQRCPSVRKEKKGKQKNAAEHKRPL